MAGPDRDHRRRRRTQLSRAAGRRSNRWQASSTATSVGARQAVGIMCRNGRDFVAAVFATGLVGADIVLVNTEFRSDALARRAEFAPSHDDVLRQRICRTDTRRARVGPDHRTGNRADPTTGEPRPKVAPSGRIVLLTSGTTGVPKGVPRVPRLSSGIGVGVTLLERTRLRVGSRIAVAVPMFHGLGLGMLMLTVSLGGTVLTHRRFDAEATLAQASLQRADAMSVVPIMLARILDLPRSGAGAKPGAVAAGGDIQRRPARSQLGATVHGCLRRHPLQRLRLHRGRNRFAGNTGRAAARARNRGQAGRGMPGAHLQQKRQARRRRA